MTYGKETREGLRKEFFQCDRKKSCTNVIKTKSGRFETINGEQQLRRRKDIEAIWKKMNIIKDISGKMFLLKCLFLELTYWGHLEITHTLKI